MLTHPNTPLRTPSRLPTPPPLALELSHAGRPVGWVRGDTIGFRGFASNVEAAHAAWVAYRTLARRLAKTHGRRPMPVDAERLTLNRRGDVDVVMASGRQIAKVLLPGPTSRGTDSFAFEIEVPPPRYEARMRGMAYLVYRTLRKSGVRWALWTRDRTPVHAPATEPRKRGGARRWATLVTVATTASAVGLLLALVVPERFAVPLSVLGLTGLLGSRLLASLTGWPATRPIRAGAPPSDAPPARDRQPRPTDVAGVARWRRPTHTAHGASSGGIHRHPPAQAVATLTPTHRAKEQTR